MAHASKDISHVVIRYADGREVKDETIDSRDYALDGGPGDEIASVTVKASLTRETFECRQAGNPPVALLESRRCGFGLCNDWTSLDSDGSHERCSHRDDTIPFRGTGSTDLDGDIATWSIDFGDGSSASGAWPTFPPVDVGHTVANPPDSGLVTRHADADRRDRSHRLGHDRRLPGRLHAGLTLARRWQP